MKALHGSLSVSRVLPLAGALVALSLVLGGADAARAQNAGAASTVFATTIHTDGFAANSVILNSTTYNVYTTAYNTTLTTGGTVDNFTSYCIDLAHRLSGNTTQASLLSMDQYNFGAASNSGNALAWMYNNLSAGATTSTQSAALQLSLWEVAYDWTGAGTNGIDLDGGAFKYAANLTSTTNFADVKAQAQNYLTQWAGQTSANNSATYINSVNADSQGLIGPGGVGGVGGGVTPIGVPEPGTLALLAMPALGLIGRTLRRRRA